MKIRTLIGTIVLGAALLAPVAHAQSPDDRDGLRGPGGIAALQQVSKHPDNRAGVRGPGAYEARQRIADRPDDRAGLRGPGAFGSSDTVSRHPDNRAGTRGPGAVTDVAVQQPRATGFDWRDALIGGLGGVGTALLLTGCLFLLMSQRSKTRMA